MLKFFGFQESEIFMYFYWRLAEMIGLKMKSCKKETNRDRTVVEVLEVSPLVRKAKSMNDSESIEPYDIPVLVYFLDKCELITCASTQIVEDLIFAALEKFNLFSYSAIHHTFQLRLVLSEKCTIFLLFLFYFLENY